jgi:hypothetical protein
VRDELRRLWELTGEIGCIAETDNDERLERVYEILSEALQYSLDTGLIEHKEEK